MFKLAAADIPIVEAEQEKPIPLIYHRSAVVQDTSLASLFWAEVGEIALTTLKGDMIPIDFVGIDADSFQATTQNVFSYLETSPVKIPGDVNTLSWQHHLYGVKLTPLQVSENLSIGVTYQLIDVSEAKVLATLAQARFSNSDAEFHITGSESADLSGYQGREVKLRVQSQGINDKATGIVAGVVELYRINRSQLDKKSAPREYTQQAARCRSYKLEQNYPNPFNPDTEIHYELPEACHVTLKIYNLLGQQIKTLVDHDAPAGSHTVRWDGKDQHGHNLASGIYLYRLEAGSYVASNKLALVR
ncbi:MAG: T9SS type A sorting domain-containing protein [candidate division KSB1 bacterium]|nr:T9SS type A sorting domain-containing protein [candidate division KSB1 bacterium]